MTLVTLDREDTVAIVTLNDPDRRNTLTPEMRTELLATLDPLLGDDPCRAVVLTGADASFCAGGDLKSMRPGEPIYARHRLMVGHRLVRLLAAGPKPVLAAVEGAAFGGGLSLAAMSDFCVAARNSRFGAAFGKVGLMADLGLLWSLPQRMGMGPARRFLMLNQVLDGEAAVAAGIADALAEPGDALKAALEQAHQFATLAPLALAATRAAFAQMPASLNTVLDLEVDMQSALMASADHAEGRAAFLEKRSPSFEGL